MPKNENPLLKAARSASLADIQALHPISLKSGLELVFSIAQTSTFANILGVGLSFSLVLCLRPFVCPLRLAFETEDSRRFGFVTSLPLKMREVELEQTVVQDSFFASLCVLLHPIAGQDVTPHTHTPKCFPYESMSSGC